jgi:hypothetical protein
MADKIKVSMKGIHRAIDQLEKKMADVDKRRPGLAKVANIRTVAKQLRNATKCQINMLLEF